MSPCHKGETGDGVEVALGILVCVGMKWEDTGGISSRGSLETNMAVLTSEAHSAGSKRADTIIEILA